MPGDNLIESIKKYIKNAIAIILIAGKHAVPPVSKSIGIAINFIITLDKNFVLKFDCKLI